MAQETQEREDEQTGSDIPGGDGTISDEDVNAIDDDGSGKATGQDHSTENRENQAPDSGVGAVQNSSDTGSDAALIDD
ncbi:MAG: hypothetical protein ABWZ66_13090 [Pyrinomonadaceae bacterium]